MGNSYAKADACPHERFLEVVQNGGGLQDLLVREADNEGTIIQVDMGYDHSSSAWMDHHEIVFSDKKASEYYLILLFPCHTNLKKQVLYTHAFSDVCALNREINARLRDSLHVSYDFGVTRLAVIYGSHIYCINNMVGTCYLVWASALNQSNHNHVSLKVDRGVPLLVNMDGYSQFEAILPLASNNGKTINVSTCKFFVPFRTFLWTDEADPRLHQRRLDHRVSVATGDQVEGSLIVGDTSRLLAREPPPFSASEAEGESGIDDDDDEDSSDEILALGMDSELYLSSVTPRIEDDKVPALKGLQPYAGQEPDEVYKK